MLERTLLPGALTSGLISPKAEGPRDEKPAMMSLMSVAPTPNAFGLSPGDLAVLQEGPLLPSEKAGNKPAFRQACTFESCQRFPLPPPQELLTIWGGTPSPGFRTQSAQLFSAKLLQELLSQPLQVIQFAPGATPIWLLPPSSPTIVPIVWLP